MGKRRRSSKGSNQFSPNPITPKKRSKGGNRKVPTTGNEDNVDAIPSTSRAGYYELLSQDNRSVITEAVTADNLSDLGGFGEEIADNRSQQAKQAKLPPVVVKNIPLDKLKRDLESNGIHAQFKLTRIGIKIMVHSKNELSLTKAYLNKLKAEFFTHDIQEEKPFKAVVRGLPLMSKEMIIEELMYRYKLQPVACHVMARQDQQDYRDCLYLIHFRRGSVTMNALKAVRSILSVIISWEPYRGSNRDVTQCMRCLNFGHGTRNCNLKPRCNVCASKHITAECPLQDATEFKCANCSENHKASDRRCVKREEYKRIRKDASTRNLPGRRAPDNRQLFNPEEFPVLPQGRFSQQRQSPYPNSDWQSRQATSSAAPTPLPRRNQVSQNIRSPPAETCDTIPQDAPLFAPQELIKIFLEMSRKLYHCRTRHDQIETLGVFIIQYGR